MRGGISVLVLLLLLVGTAHAQYELSELVSDEALFAVWAKGLPKLLTEVERTIQREGLQQEDVYRRVEAFVRQVAPMVPMLIGIELREFLRLFGREIVLAVYEVDRAKPSLAILADTRHDPQGALAVIDEIRMLIEAGGRALPTRETYRGVDHEEIHGQGWTIRFGAIEGIFVVGLNGGFPRVVDRTLGDGNSIASNGRFREIENALGSEGQLMGFADLTRLGPVLRRTGIGTGPIMDVLLPSLDSAGLSIDITGYELKFAVRAGEPQGSLAEFLHPLVFAARPPMLSSSWLAETEGLWMGANVGDLPRILDHLMARAEQMSERLDRLSTSLGVSVRDDVLPLLSGEFSVMLNLPEGRFEPEKHRLDLLKLNPVVCIGLHDVDAFAERLGKMMRSLGDSGTAQFQVVRREEVYGQDMVQLFVLSDAHLPGIALTPTATIFREHDGSGLVVLSNRAAPIRSLLEAIRDTPVDGRAAMYLPVGDVFRMLVNQRVASLPEPIAERIGRIRPVVIVLSTDADTLRVSLTSPETPWLNQLINGTIAGMFGHSE